MTDTPVDPRTSAPFAGVRVARNGPVVFCATDGAELAKGQLVVIAFTDEAPTRDSQGPASAASEELATVVFTARQLLENEAGVPPSARILRPATADEIVQFSRRAADGQGLTEQAETILQAMDPSCRAVDAWLSADQAQLTVVIDTLRADPAEAARALEHDLGLPVVLRRANGEDSVAISGVGGAGLPGEWTEWIAAPGDPPSVRPLQSPALTTARLFIDKLFPPADRATWERPRRERGGSGSGG